MKRFAVLFLLASLVATTVSAQKSGDKRIWAKSYLGEQAPELVVEKWVSDKPDLEGKYILVEFWATWCGPCRKAIPKLNAMQAKFADKLVIIGISDEKEEQVKDMISPKIEYSSAIDTRALLKSKYQVTGVPHAVLISPDGVVLWEGFPMLPGEELTEEVVASLIN